MADVEQISALFAVWDRALREYAARPRWGSEFAYDAMGYAALFHTYIDKDPLLNEIHATFGQLETMAGDESEGRSLWELQARRINDAKHRYGDTSARDGAAPSPAT